MECYQEWRGGGAFRHLNWRTDRTQACLEAEEKEGAERASGSEVFNGEQSGSPD